MARSELLGLIWFCFDGIAPKTMLIDAFIHSSRGEGLCQKARVRAFPELPNDYYDCEIK